MGVFLHRFPFFGDRRGVVGWVEVEGHVVDCCAGFLESRVFQVGFRAEHGCHGSVFAFHFSAISISSFRTCSVGSSPVPRKARRIGPSLVRSFRVCAFPSRSSSVISGSSMCSNSSSSSFSRFPDKSLLLLPPSVQTRGMRHAGHRSAYAYL